MKVSINSLVAGTSAASASKGKLVLALLALLVDLDGHAGLEVLDGSGGGRVDGPPLGELGSE